MARRKDVDWNLGEGTATWDQVKVAVMMDIRDELKRLNTLLHCSNFQQIPRVLRSIRRNTYKRRKPTPKRVVRRKRRG